MALIKVFGTAPASLNLDALRGHRVIVNANLGVSAELDAALVNADAFLLLPHSDPLMALSLLVAKQYNTAFTHKTIAVWHTPEMPNAFVTMVRGMQAAGVVPQAEDALYTIVESVAGVHAQLGKVAAGQNIDTPHLADNITHYPNPNSHSHAQRPDFNVCILGSYSTKDPNHIHLAGQLGDMLYANQWGLVYGGSDKGMMKAFAAAASGADHGGYVKAVIPELYLWHGLDAELHDFINAIDVTSDIYVRMQHMAKQSDVFVAAPGGLGTAQEIAALLSIKKSDAAQAQKPLILLNGDGFWDGMIQVLEAAGYHQGTDFIAAQNLAAVYDVIEHYRATHTHAAKVSSH